MDSSESTIFFTEERKVNIRRELRKLTGERIRKIRLILQLSQEEVSSRAEVHPCYYGQIERGTKSASTVTLLKIAAALNTKLSTLLDPDYKTERCKSELLLKEAGNKYKMLTPAERKLVRKFIYYLIKQKKSRLLA